MQLPYVAAAAAFGTSVTLVGMAAYLEVAPSDVIAQLPLLAAEASHFIAYGLKAVCACRFAIEATLLAFAAALDITLRLLDHEPGQKYRRAEVTIITIYVMVITVNVLSVVVGNVAGQAGTIA